MSKPLHYDVGEMLIHKSNQLMAFNKPSGLAVQSAKDTDLCQLTNAYAQRKLYLIHRIDQPASGVILFGRNAQTAAKVSDQFRNGQVKRTYYAVVKNRPVKDAETLEHIIHTNHRRNKTYIDPSRPSKGGERAKLSYQYCGSSDRYHLLEVQLDTGRHHQIRAQLSHIGSPIKGDVKYGDRRSNKDRSIHLHAYSLQIHHPISQDVLEIVAPLPQDPLWDYFDDLLLSR